MRSEQKINTKGQYKATVLTNLTLKLKRTSLAKIGSCQTKPLPKKFSVSISTDANITLDGRTYPRRKIGCYALEKYLVCEVKNAAD